MSRVRGLVRARPDAADGPADAELLDRFHRTGDAGAFETIVRRHGPRVLSAARQVLGRSPDADDVYQAAFLTLAREAARIRRRPALGGWLSTVAHRLALLARTDAARRARIEGRRPAPAAVEPPDVTVREAHDILHEELNRLPDALRLPLLLCYLDGLTRDEAARELGVGVEVVRGRLERGRDKLRTRLERRGVSLPAGLLVVAAGPASAAPAESLVRAAVAGATAGAAPAAVRTLTRLGTASMILARVKSAAVAVAAVGLVCSAVVLGATEAPDAAPAPVSVSVSAAEPPAPVPPREPAGDDGPVLTGRVVDEAGAAVAGAKVQFVMGGWDYPTTHTDRGGAFRLVLLPESDDPRTYPRVVLATDADGRRQGVARFNLVRSGRDLTITLRPARTTTVRVRDAAKQPVAGAQVVLTAERISQFATATTGGDGAAVVRYPADVAVSFVCGFKGGAGFDYVSTLKERGGKDRVSLPAEVALQLSGARAATVKVIDSADRPVAGLAVLPWGIDGPDRTDEANLSGCKAVQAVSDAAGVATFDWLPADVRGRGISFLLASREYGQPDFVRLTQKSPVEVGPMRVIRKAKLSGRVLRADGTPAAGVHVDAEGVAAANRYGYGHTSTRVDGSYQMTVNGENVYTVGVRDDRWGVPCRSGLVVREGATLGGLDFTLAEGTVVRGRLTAGAGKRPVAGEQMLLKEDAGEFPAVLRVGPQAERARDELSFTRAVYTDADGGYRFRVGRGAYTLYHPGTDRTVSFTIEREREVVKDLHLPRPPREDPASRD